MYLQFSGTTSDYLFNINHFVFTPLSNSRIGLLTDAETNDNHIRLFPSPADQEIIIEVGEELNKDTRVLIYDNSGRQVLASTLKGSKSRIPVGSFSPGIYIIRLFNGQTLVTKKIMKK